jgi:hypothetical protein
MSNRNTVTPEQMNNSDIQPIDAVSPPTIAKPTVVGMCYVGDPDEDLLIERNGVYQKANFCKYDLKSSL